MKVLAGNDAKTLYVNLTPEQHEIALRTTADHMALRMEGLEERVGRSFRLTEVTSVSAIAMPQRRRRDAAQEVIGQEELGQ
jgi:hypothetical protein